MPGHHGCPVGRQLRPHHSSQSSTPGPMLDLGRQFQTLLSEHNQPLLLARRWSGHWDPVVLESLRPMIARWTRKQIKAVLGHIARITRSMTSDCWRQFAVMARELNPPPAAPHTPLPLSDQQMSTIVWDPRLGEQGPRLNTKFPSPCFVRLLTELAIQHSGAGGSTLCSILPKCPTAWLLFTTVCLFPALVL